MMKNSHETMQQQISLIDKYLLEDISKVKEAAENLLSISNYTDNNYGKAYAFAYLAYYYIYKQGGELVNYSLKRARDLVDKSDVELIIDLHIISGLHNKSVGNEYTAACAFLDVMLVLEKNKYYEGVAFSSLQIGMIYEELGDLQLAEKYLKKAVDAGKLAKSIRGVVVLKQCYKEYILVMCSLQKIDEAKSCLGEMLKEKYEDFDFDIELLKIVINSLDKKEILDDCKIYLQNIDNYQGSKIFLFDNLHYLTQLLIDKKQKIMAQKYLYLINNEYEESLLNRSILIAKTKIKYQETFNEQFEDDVYKELYELINEKLKTDDKIMSDNLKSEILLSELHEESAEKIKEKEGLEKIASIDELTQIYNRSYHNKILTKLEVDKRIKSLGYIMIDIDSFKEYNDNYGHIEGDRILKEVGAIFQKYAEENVIACRYGGDEFVVFCVNMTDDEIETYINNLRTSLEEAALEHKYSPISNIITLSIGYDNQTKDDSFSMKQLMDNADRASYNSKRHGRNRWTRFQETKAG